MGSSLHSLLSASTYHARSELTGTLFLLIFQENYIPYCFVSAPLDAYLFCFDRSANKEKRTAPNERAQWRYLPTWCGPNETKSITRCTALPPLPCFHFPVSWPPPNVNALILLLSLSLSVLVRLQIGLGPRRVRGRTATARAVRPHLETRYCTV